MFNYSCLIVIDSRGAEMEDELRACAKDLPIDITYVVLYGARIQKLTNEAIKLSLLNDYDLVLILGGVNNLSHKHSSGRITPIYYDSQHLLHSLSNQFTIAQSSFFDNVWVPKLIFAKVCGLDVEKYNRFKTGSSPDYSQPQQVINQGILQLNQSISVLNTAAGTISPWITDDIHYYNNSPLP